MIEDAIKLPTEEAQRITSELRRIIPRKSHLQLITYCLALALENARLCFEVNRLRDQLGIAPMKRYMPGE